MNFPIEKVRAIAKQIHFNGDIEQLRMGISVESEHKDILKKPIDWARIAKNHLDEFKDYYSRLKIIESPSFKIEDYKQQGGLGLV